MEESEEQTKRRAAGTPTSPPAPPSTSHPPQAISKPARRVLFLVGKSLLQSISYHRHLLRLNRAAPTKKILSAEAARMKSLLREAVQYMYDEKLWEAHARRRSPGATALFDAFRRGLQVRIKKALVEQCRQQERSNSVQTAITPIKSSEISKRAKRMAALVGKGVLQKYEYQMVLAQTGRKHKVLSEKAEKMKAELKRYV